MSAARWSLPVALPHRTFAAVRRRDDGALRCVSDVAGSAPWTGRVDHVTPGAVTGWAAYAVGPLWALRQTGWAGLDQVDGGYDIALVSCLPLGQDCAATVKALADGYGAHGTVEAVGSWTVGAVLHRGAPARPCCLHNGCPS